MTMDDNVMRVLQMLQDGKISAQEAEMLIAALRGESAQAEEAKEKEKEKEQKEEKPFFGNFGFETWTTLASASPRPFRAFSPKRSSSAFRRNCALPPAPARTGAPR
jgi:hypothetical protein